MNYKILQGETLSVFHTWEGKDLTGWTGSMYIYDRAETLLATIPLTCDVDGNIEGSASSAAWTVGTYDYYLRLNDGAGFYADLLKGKVCVE